MLEQLSLAVIVIVAVLLLGLIAIVVKMYQKAVQGEALVRTGLGDTKVSFSGIFVIKVQMLDVIMIRSSSSSCSVLSGTDHAVLNRITGFHYILRISPDTCYQDQHVSVASIYPPAC